MKQPKQQRSRVTVDAIITAAAHILSEGDWETFNTNSVAERAGVSVGSLYQYFPNKAALIEEIGRRHEARLIETIRKSAVIAAGTTIRETAELFVQGHIDAQKINPHLHNTLSQHLHSDGRDYWLTNYRATMIAALEGHLRARPRTSKIEHLSEVAFVLFHAVEGIVRSALKQSRNAGLNRAIHFELTRMVIAYLVELTGHGADA